MYIYSNLHRQTSSVFCDDNISISIKMLLVDSQLLAYVYPLAECATCTVLCFAVIGHSQ